MSGFVIPGSKPLNRLIDFIVLALTYFFSSMLFTAASGSQSLLEAIGYATILLAFISISGRVILRYQKTWGEFTRQIVVNGFGILVGTVVVLALTGLYQVSSASPMTVVFSSIMAFFILGTLSPIVHRDPIVPKDSIVHK